MSRRFEKLLSPPPHIAVRGPCDLWCAFCNARGVRHLATEGERESVTAQLEGLAELGHRIVGFGLQHSEPTTHPALLELVERARQLGFERVMLSTSGLSLVDRAYTTSLVDAGLTDVNITLVGLADDLTDVLLGRRGAGAAKLKAIEVCVREKLSVFVVLALLRPSLRFLPELTKTVNTIFGERGDRLHLNALLLDPVEGMKRERIELLWPRFGEIQWIMLRLRALNPDIELQAHHLPTCARRRIKGVTILDQPDSSVLPQPTLLYPSGLCEECPERSGCAGMAAELAHIHRGISPDSIFVESPPPDLDREQLQNALGSLRSSSTSRAALDQLKACAAPLFMRMSRERRTVLGFTVDEVAVDIDGVAATLRSGHELLSVIVEPADATKNSYLTSARVALSYRKDTPVDTKAKHEVMRALMELVDRALDRLI